MLVGAAGNADDAGKLHVMAVPGPRPLVSVSTGVASRTIESGQDTPPVAFWPLPKSGIFRVAEFDFILAHDYVVFALFDQLNAAGQYGPRTEKWQLVVK